MSSPLVKCVFMGSDPIAIPMLDAIIQQHQDTLSLEAIFTQPDRRTGRGKKLTPNAIKIWAEEHNVPVYQPTKLGKEDRELFEEKQWQLCLVMAYGHIISQKLLDTPEYGFYNLHASILPKLRGASPIETAIVTGEKETGVTMMKVIKALDAGPIVDLEKCKIDDKTNALELREKLANICVPLLNKTIQTLLSADPKLLEQENENATYCRLIEKHDGLLDFNMKASEIINHIRGFHPWPGAIFNYKTTSIKIGSAEEVETPETLQQSQPGTLIVAEKRIWIKCKHQSIEIQTLQKPGGKMIKSADFLNGFNFEDSNTLDFPSQYPLTKSKYFRKATK